MPEVHGVGLNQPNVLDSYKKEMEEAELDSQRATQAAQKMVAEKIQRESAAKSQIFGEVLGNMYDGDREAIENFRLHIKNEFESGVYSTDPGLYATRIKNLNAMIDNAENFYKTTYGDDSADGKGNTYRDIQIRHERGNSVEFWEEQGLELKDDEWAEAQKRLQELQGGMYRNLQFTPDGRVMASPYNEETGELGELVNFENLPQREIGSQNFIPDTRVLSPASMMELAGTQDVQVRLRQLYSGLLSEDGQVTYEGQLVDVKGMSSAQKMNYMSDLYFDDMVREGANSSTARGFRRSLARDINMTDEQVDMFVNGDIEALRSLNGGAAAYNEARRHWREVTRQSFIKPRTQTRTGGGSGQQKEVEYDFVTGGYTYNVRDIDQQEFDSLGLLNPFTESLATPDITGDRLKAGKEIKVNASTALIAEGFKTEEANYEIHGAAHVKTEKLDGTRASAYIVTVQVPVLESVFNEATEKWEDVSRTITKNILVSNRSNGFHKEVYNNLLNNASDLALAMGARDGEYMDDVIQTNAIPTNPNR